MRATSAIAIPAVLLTVPGQPSEERVIRVPEEDEVPGASPRYLRAGFPGAAAEKAVTTLLKDFLETPGVREALAKVLKRVLKDPRDMDERKLVKWLSDLIELGNTEGDASEPAEVYA